MRALQRIRWESENAYMRLFYLLSHSRQGQVFRNAVKNDTARNALREEIPFLLKNDSMRR